MISTARADLPDFPVMAIAQNLDALLRNRDLKMHLIGNMHVHADSLPIGSSARDNAKTANGSFLASGTLLLLDLECTSDQRRGASHSRSMVDNLPGVGVGPTDPRRVTGNQ